MFLRGAFRETIVRTGWSRVVLADGRIRDCPHAYFGAVMDTWRPSQFGSARNLEHTIALGSAVLTQSSQAIGIGLCAMGASRSEHAFARQWEQ